MFPIDTSTPLARQTHRIAAGDLEARKTAELMLQMAARM